MKLLLAEDNTVNAMMLAYYLEKQSVLLTTVANGADAILAILQKEQTADAFDAAIMDVQMPIMDGLTAVRNLRSQGIRIPIIACSAILHLSERDECLAAGFTRLISKPVDAQEMIKTLVSFYQPRGQQPVRFPASAQDGGAALNSFAALLARYRVSLASYYETIEKAELVRNCEEIAKIAHRLHGTGTNYGFPDLTTAAGDCERSLKAGLGLDDIRDQLRSLKLIIREILSSAPTD